jgi:UPF0176 protein
MAGSPVQVAALYRFAAFEDLAALKAALDVVCADAGIRGTLLLAPEGINGTIAGTSVGVETVLGHVRRLPGCAGLDVKYSQAETMPFHRMKVRVKKEIVTMGQPGIDPTRDAGAYVSPEEWNALISDPDTLVIDTRNDYEVRIGSFAGAVDPKTASFREFPAWFRDRRDVLLAGKSRVAMFCTGGIRCEKATAFLKAEGVKQVFHLEGGILRYLEMVAKESSLWEGECFVFDQRVAVGQGLAEGSHTLCFGCRMPVNAEDRQSPHYRQGVSCPACHDARDDDSRARYAERQRQMEIADRLGIEHVGAVDRR